MAYKSKHQLKPKRHFWEQPLVWILFFFLVVSAGIIYFFFFYQTFQVQTIDIAGNQAITTDDLRQTILNHLEREIVSAGPINVASKNIFLVDLAVITKAIQSQFPNIDEFALKKQLPNTLSITIEERQPVGFFCDEQSPPHCFFIDAKGVIFQAVTDIPPDIIIIRRPTLSDFVLGESVITKSTMTVIKTIQQNLQETFSLASKEAVVGDLLTITTQEGWSVYFDLDQEVALEIAKLNALLKNEISIEERQKLQYIYLQYKDRAYFK